MNKLQRSPQTKARHAIDLRAPRAKFANPNSSPSLFSADLAPPVAKIYQLQAQSTHGSMAARAAYLEGFEEPSWPSSRVLAQPPQWLRILTKKHQPSLCCALPCLADASFGYFLWIGEALREANWIVAPNSSKTYPKAIKTHKTLINPHQRCG